jgi:hypothetical protein
MRERKTEIVCVCVRARTRGRAFIYMDVNGMHAVKCPAKKT